LATLPYFFGRRPQLETDNDGEKMRERQKERDREGERADLQNAHLRTDFTTLSTGVFAFILETQREVPHFPALLISTRQTKYTK